MVGGKVLSLELKVVELILCKFMFLVSSNIFRYLKLFILNYSCGNSLGSTS